MYCKQCGAEIANDVAFCPICGAKVEGANQASDEFASYNQTNSGPEKLETLTICAFVLAFIQPLIGLILAIISNSNNYGPRNKTFLKAAMIISIVLIALSVISVILVVVLMLIIDGSLINHINISNLF